MLKKGFEGRYTSRKHMHLYGCQSWPAILLFFFLVYLTLCTMWLSKSSCLSINRRIPISLLFFCCNICCSVKLSMLLHLCHWYNFLYFEYFLWEEKKKCLHTFKWICSSWQLKPARYAPRPEVQWGTVFTPFFTTKCTPRLNPPCYPLLSNLSIKMLILNHPFFYYTITRFCSLSLGSIAHAMYAYITLFFFISWYLWELRHFLRTHRNGDHFQITANVFQHKFVLF